MASRTPCCFLEFSDTERDGDSDETTQPDVESEAAKDSDAQFHIQMISSILEIADETSTSSDPNIERHTENSAGNRCLLLPIKSRQDSEVLQTSKAVKHHCETKVNLWRRDAVVD